MVGKKNDGQPGEGFSRRRFLSTAFTAAGALVVGGGQAVAATGTPRSGEYLVAQAKPLAGRTIRYQQRASGAENFVTKIFAPRFEEETGCKVVLEDIPQAELYAKVQIMAVGGQLGDLVFGFDNPQLASWGSKGILRPIDDYIQADNYDMAQFYPGVLTAVTVNGEIYGLPTAGHPGCVNLFYNKTMMEKAGVTPPDAKYPDDAWSWDDILASAKALTRQVNGKTETWGFLPSKFNSNWAYVHTRQFGGDVMTEDGKTATIGNDKGQEAYRYLQDLTYEFKVTPTPADIPAGPTHSTEKIAGSNFATGQVAMFEDATILITTMGNYVKDFEWGVFPVPAGPGGSRGGTLFMNCTMITKNSKDPEAAWQFLKLICSHEAGVQKLLTNSGSPGMRPDVFRDPEVTKAFPWFLVGDKVMQEAKPSWRPANLKSAEVSSAIIQGEASIWLNDVPAEQGAMNLQKAIQQILDEPA